MAAWTQRLLGLRPRIRISALRSRDLPPPHAYMLAPGIPTPGPPILLRPSITRTHKYPNINGFPISYAFPPRLRGRLTLGRLPLPRKPWVYGERVFHPFYRYSCQHNHFPAVHHTFWCSFSPQGTLPYQTATHPYPPRAQTTRSTSSRLHASVKSATLCASEAA